MQISDQELDSQFRYAYRLNKGEHQYEDDFDSNTLRERKAEETLLRAKLKKSQQSGNSSSVDQKKTTGIKKKKKRKKKGDNNETMLDGTLAPNLRTFSQQVDANAKFFTAEEIRHTGLMGAIPPATLTQTYPRAKLASAETMQRMKMMGGGGGGGEGEGGSSYSRQAALKGYMYEESRQAIAVEYPQWITLRESYLQQLVTLSNEIIHVSTTTATSTALHDRSNNNTTTSSSRQTHVEHDDAHLTTSQTSSNSKHRLHFLLLLTALRKVSLRLMGEFKHQNEQALRTRRRECSNPVSLNLNKDR